VKISRELPIMTSEIKCEWSKEEMFFVTDLLILMFVDRGTMCARKGKMTDTAVIYIKTISL